VKITIVAATGRIGRLALERAIADGHQVTAVVRNPQQLPAGVPHVRADVEKCMGGWVWFTGMRLQYGYDWINVIPPQAGDIGNVNVLLSTGVRYSSELGPRSPGGGTRRPVPPPRRGLVRLAWGRPFWGFVATVGWRGGADVW